MFYLLIPIFIRNVFSLAIRHIKITKTLPNYTDELLSLHNFLVFSSKENIAYIDLISYVEFFGSFSRLVYSDRQVLKPLDSPFELDNKFATSEKRFGNFVVEHYTVNASGNYDGKFFYIHVDLKFNFSYKVSTALEIDRLNEASNWIFENKTLSKETKFLATELLDEKKQELIESWYTSLFNGENLDNETLCERLALLKLFSQKMGKATVEIKSSIDNSKSSISYKNILILPVTILTSAAILFISVTLGRLL